MRGDTAEMSELPDVDWHSPQSQSDRAARDVGLSRMMGVYRGAFGAQGVLLIYLQLIEWVDLYPWNDIRRGNGQEVLDIALGVFMLLSLGATWRHWWPGLLVAAMGYAAWLSLQVATFWIPYVMGATPRWQQIHAANFSATVQWLPRWDAHLPPDASHFVLQLVLVVALVMTALALRAGYREARAGRGPA